MITQTKKALRTRVRAAALFGLSRAFDYADRTEQALAKPMVHFPYFHAVPLSEMVNFRAFLSELSKTHNLISYSDAIDRVVKGSIDRPYAAISFDDGFKSNLEAAYALEDYGTTGTFFVPTNAIGLSTVTQARDFFKFSEGCDEPVMDWSDLEELKNRGHEIGNHTLTHRTLSGLSHAEAADEISQAAEVMRSRLGSCDHFAWPNGRFHHFKKDLIQTVYASGHVSCASAERGAHSVVHSGSPESLCIRRDHVMSSWPLDTNRYFLARSAERSSELSNLYPVDDWPEP